MARLGLDVGGDLSSADMGSTISGKMTDQHIYMCMYIYIYIHIQKHIYIYTYIYI